MLNECSIPRCSTIHGSTRQQLLPGSCFGFDPAQISKDLLFWPSSKGLSEQVFIIITVSWFQLAIPRFDLRTRGSFGLIQRRSRKIFLSKLQLMGFRHRFLLQRAYPSRFSSLRYRGSSLPLRGLICAHGGVCFGSQGYFFVVLRLLRVPVFVVLQGTQWVRKTLTGKGMSSIRCCSLLWPRRGTTTSSHAPAHKRRRRSVGGGGATWRWARKKEAANGARQRRKGGHWQA
jgi:hypothetical protein